MSWSPEPNNRPDYRIYTTKYDLEINGRSLIHNLSPLTRADWEQQVADYRATTETFKTKAALVALNYVEAIRERPSFAPSKTAVSILVDHSGSLRGQRAIIACLTVEIVADFLSRIGVRYEILGFTTAQWKGGRSRMMWERKGRPSNPGRLNDLLHIVYRHAADNAPGAPYSVYHLLRSELLKENVDGEALFWAAERLKNIGCAENKMLVISDGAPVDDSTLDANFPEILWEHLKAVIKDLSATPGFTLGGVGIDYDLTRLYEMTTKVDGLGSIADTVPKFVASLFQDAD